MKSIVVRSELLMLQLQEEGVLPVTICGYSMEPTFQMLQKVLAVKPLTLEPGKCYVFRGYTSLKVHRLVKVTKKARCYFAGDNSCSIESVDRSNVLAFIDDNRTMFFRGAVNVLNYAMCNLAGNKLRFPILIQRVRYRIICFLTSLDKLLLKGSM